MGSAQSTESGRPTVTETANFDFRNEPATNVRWGGVSSTINKEQETRSSNSRGWLDEQSSFNRSEGRKNKGSKNIYCWQDTKSHSWLDDGMDVAKKIENEGRAMNIYGARS